MSGEVTDRVAKTNDGTNDAQMALIHEYAQTALKEMPNNASENGHGMFYTRQDLQQLKTNEPNDASASNYLLKNFNGVANLYNDKNQGFWGDYSVNQYGISNNDLTRLAVGSDTKDVGHGVFAHSNAWSDARNGAIAGGLASTAIGAVIAGLKGTDLIPGLPLVLAGGALGAAAFGFLGYKIGYSNGADYERSLQTKIKSFGT